MINNTKQIINVFRKSLTIYFDAAVSVLIGSTTLIIVLCVCALNFSFRVLLLDINNIIV